MRMINHERSPLHLNRSRSSSQALRCDVPIPQFDRGCRALRGTVRALSVLPVYKERHERARLSLFLVGRLLLNHSLFFLLVFAGGFGLFLRGFLLVGFRIFVTHNITFILRVDLPVA